MAYRNLEEVFEAFNNLNVLIVGDVMIDSYIWGNVDRISPEAPVPIIQVNKKEKRLGGAANVAKNIQALGATPFLCSVIGDDADGYELLKILKQRNLSLKGLVQSRDRQTTIKERVMSGSQHLLRVDSENLHEINPKDTDNLLDQIDDLLPDCHVVIMEDYNKGVLHKTLINKIIRKACDYKIPTVVDPKKYNFLSYKNVTLFKPNLKEIKEGLKLDFESSNLDALKDAINLLIEKLSIDMTMVTLSEQGIYIKSQKEQYHLPAHIRSISDVSGAGDTMISTFTLADLCGANAIEAANIANIAASIVCAQGGVVPINVNDLLQSI